MENKKQKSTGKTVAIIILVVLLICSLGYIAYDKFLYKLLKKDNNVTEEKTNKEEKLDVNSRLVQNLYHKVSTGEMSKEDATCYFNYMYGTYTEEGYMLTDFYANQADETQKMQILALSLSSNEKKYYSGEESLIPDEIPGYGHKSILAANREYNRNEIQYYYNKSYIDRSYKELYGKNAQLNTSIPISVDQHGISLYSYVPAVDKYILYMAEGGGTCGTADYATLTKATKNEDELKIYEKVTGFVLEDFSVEDNGKTTSYKKDQVISEDNYIYTFKLEDDGMYSFYSRVKES